MQLHPSAPFGVPDLSLTLTPALESGPPRANNTHLAGFFEQSLCPPPPSPLAPVAAVFLPVQPDPTCATSLPARRACLRVEHACASCKSACLPTCSRRQARADEHGCGKPACARACLRYESAYTSLATRQACCLWVASLLARASITRIPPPLLQIPACASLPARRACLHVAVQSCLRLARCECSQPSSCA